MFWRFGGYANISTIDTILDKPDVTLEELLDESDLIQELKQQNSKLIEFLRDEPVLKKLLDYVIADKPSEDAAAAEKTEKDAAAAGKDEEKDKSQDSPISFFGKGKSRDRSKSTNKRDSDGGETEAEKSEAQRKKYAYVACEVLSSEVWSLTEAVLEQREHLREFWQYIRRPAPLDPTQASYFTKVNEALLDKKTEDMLNHFKSLDGIVPAMLQHVDCPMVMDLLLKIISLEKNEGGQGIVDWLQAQDLIPLLLTYLSPEQSSATQTSAGDFLKAIITISANATTQDQSVIGPNELTRQLVSEECIHTLITDMLRGGNPLTVGVGIIIEVIRKNNSDYDLDNQVGPEPKTSDPIYLGTLLRQFATHVPDFMNLIRSQSAKKPDLKAAFGSKIEPLGFDRFKTCELMAELLHCSNMGLLNERGADEEVRKRDAERERLKAQGQLTTPRAPGSPGAHESSFDEFGSSVDSHGFHHAERPTQEEMNEQAEDRRLEIQNASDEDGFEKVNAPGADEEEVTFDELNDKIDRTTHGGLPLLEKVEKVKPAHLETREEDAAMPAPLSPKKSPTKPALHFDPPPTEAAADSPTTAGVTDQIKSLDVDEDVVMSEFGEDPVFHDDENAPSELERELARAEDKPAPLFAAKKDPPAAPASDHNETAAAEDGEISQSVATIQAPSPTATTDRAPYDTELDGSPVVGDLLKIQFVEHQVVPTILDFFFRFPWNNFLHNVVYDVVQQVFNGTLDRGYNRTLAFDLFTPVPEQTAESKEAIIGLASAGDITTRILEGQKASDASQKEKGMRLGYMGHLTLIAEEVCKFGNRHPPEILDPAIGERVGRAEWMEYVEGILAETRDRDNAVLGGVRPETAIGVRAGGGVGNFGGGGGLASVGLTSNMTPQDTLALSEGTVGQSTFEIEREGGFGDDDDEDAEEERRTGGVDDDEQTTTSSPTDSSKPPPLNIAPSRARRTLAARLAQRSQEQAVESGDPDAADATAVETASLMPEDGDGLVDLGEATDHEMSQAAGTSGLQITGLRTVSGSGAAGRFSGLFSSSDSSDDEDDASNSSDEGDAGRDHTVGRAEGDFEQAESSGRRLPRRRPSTTEAKERRAIDDFDDDDDDNNEEGMGKEVLFGIPSGNNTPGVGGLRQEEESASGSSSDDEGMVEIRTRRSS